MPLAQKSNCSSLLNVTVAVLYLLIGRKKAYVKIPEKNIKINIQKEGGVRRGSGQLGTNFHGNYKSNTGSFVQNSSIKVLGFGAQPEARQSADKEVLVGHQDLLDVVGIGHCRRERWGGRRVFYGLGERAQDTSRHPALGRRRVAVGRPVNQVHVLLVGGQDLDRLTLSDTDLVFLECRVVLNDPHGGGDTVTATVRILGRSRKIEGGKMTEEEEEETEGKDRSDGGREDGDSWGHGYGLVYVGWITVRMAATPLQRTNTWEGAEGGHDWGGGGGGVKQKKHSQNSGRGLHI